MFVNSIMTSSGALLCGMAMVSIATGQASWATGQASWATGQASWATGQASSKSSHRNDLATFNTLEETFLKVGASEGKLSDVLKTLQDELDVMFVLDPSTDDYGLDAETVIKFTRPKEIRAATALAMILKKYECTWSIQDGVVRVISVDCAFELESLNFMTFQCGDLIERIRPVTKVSPPPVQHFPGMGGVFAIPPRWNHSIGKSLQETVDEVQPAEKADAGTMHSTLWVKKTVPPLNQLIDLIQVTVDPESWSMNGGTGSIVAVNNVLVVRQTQNNLRQINHLLNALRKTNLEN